MDDPYAEEPTSRPFDPVWALPPTGELPAGPPARKSFVQRHKTPLMVAAAVAVVVAAGGAGWAMAGSGSTPSKPVAAGTPSLQPSQSHQAGGGAIRGTVQAESGNTWTVHTRTGATVTVLITSKTQFGKKKDPSSATRFPVGAAVVVTGHAQDSTITASRISAPAKAPSVGPTT